MHEALVDFATAVEQTPELRMVLRNPQLESSQKARILSDLAGDEELLFKNFLLLVAEKVTRRSLDDADHKRLIEDAVGELDFSVLEGNDS